MPMPDELRATWNEVRAELQGAVTDLTFHTWLAPLELVWREGAALRVRAPRHIRTLVEERYLPVIRRAAEVSLGPSVTIEIVSEQWVAPADEPQDRPPSGPRGDLLNPKYTFDQFVIGGGNRLAHAAALAVAELPGQAYNPLFLYGPPGLGKTHLLHAIGNYVQDYGDGLSVRYTTIEAFTNEFISAVHGPDSHAFKERFRGVDVLLIDDAQFLANKVKTKEEFFHTFNALYEAGSQVVITSDRPPIDMDELETRLRERFACGLVAELEPPSLEVRMAILRKRAALDSLAEVADETLDEVARHVTTSVRTLEGALIRVVAYASLRGTPATPEVARRLLERFYPSCDARECTLDDVRAAAAAAFDLDPGLLLAKDRRPDVVFARQVAMYLARELTDASLPAIGAKFGGRNHSTVLHAHGKIARSLETDATARRAVDNVRTELGRPA